MSNWLLLHYKLPTRPSVLRVYIWRKLKRLGAILLQEAIWVLPDLPRTADDFEAMERGSLIYDALYEQLKLASSQYSCAGRQTTYEHSGKNSERLSGVPTAVLGIGDRHFYRPPRHESDHTLPGDLYCSEVRGEDHTSRIDLHTFCNRQWSGEFPGRRTGGSLWTAIHADPGLGLRCD